ncbi:ABC transporter permease [Tengunoibacter tsumagoiensis]|uniref:Glutathione transport system permease protein GsiD n=1 Tax=Tengunoibacter tsumagoiensis TaxID=2014871 RepID=A0A402A3U8_9CHLR|nr:ABC transporter permease [Tengunoibacter tsumagoiensis]GCE13729.1 glutathione transport system permease protein GsiD [Tengunoibacter tsumagoiensis]
MSQHDAEQERTEVLPPAETEIENALAVESLVVLEGQDGKEPKVGSKKDAGTPFRDSLRRLRKDKRAMVSLSIIVLYILIALFGPWIYQHIGSDYTSNVNGRIIHSEVYHNFSHQEPDRQDEGPSGQYWLGTDAIGRDLFARLMQGMLISICVAFAVEVVDVVLGITIGVLAGYYGGWIDQLLARFADVIFAFPGLLFAILLVGILGTRANDTLGKIPVIGPNGNARLLLVSIALAFTVWPLMARYVRGQTLQLKEQQFVEAARTSGTSDIRILLRHIIPNLFSIVVISSTLNIVNTIVGEAGLSLLGLGVQTPGASLGLMISDGAVELSVHPWEALLPAGVLVLIVLALSYLSDGLRDAFDPRAKD